MTSDGEPMAPDHIHDINMRLGQLEGTLRTFMQTWRDQDTAANLARRVTHEKQELMMLQVNRISTDVQNVQQDVAELKNEIDDKVMPVVETVKAEQARRLGVRSVWALIVGGVMTILSALAYIADRIITHFRP